MYKNISKSQYLALKRAVNKLKVIPSMCVLFLKNEKYGKPLRSKSCIVVLGNFEERFYQKSQRYASVLKYISLSLLISNSFKEKLILQQGYCKNTFCNSTLSEDEVTVIIPPIRDPDFQDDEYWLLKKHYMCYIYPPIIGTT